MDHTPGLDEAPVTRWRMATVGRMMITGWLTALFAGCGAQGGGGDVPRSVPIPPAPRVQPQSLLHTLREVSKGPSIPEPLELGSPLMRHPGGVNVLHFSADGHLISGGWDGRLVKQSLQDGTPVWSHSPFRGRALLSAHPLGGGSLLLRGPEGHEATFDLRHPGQPATSPRAQSGLVAYSADGLAKGAVSERGRVTLELGGSPRGLGKLPGGESRVLAVDSKGERVLVGDATGHLRAFGGASGQPLWTAKVSQGLLTALLVVPEAGEVLAAGVDGRLKGVALKDGALLREYTRVEAGIFALALSQNGDALFVGDKGGWIHKRSYPEGARLGEAFVHRAPISAMSLSPDGTHLATGDRAGVIQVVDADSLAIKTPVDGRARHLHWVTEVAACGGEGPYATLTRDGIAHVWDSDGHHRYQVQSPQDNPIRSLACRPGDSAITLGFALGQLRFLDPAGGIAQEVTLDGGALRGVTYSRDGSVLVAINGRRFVYVLNGKDGRVRRRFGPFPSAIESLALSPKGDRLLLGLKDPTVLVLSTDDPAPLRRLTLPKGGPLDLAFLGAEGAFVVAAGEAGAFVFGPRWKRPLEVGPRRFAGAVSVAEDGSLFHLGGRDGTVSAWDGIALTEVGKMGAHARPITDLAALGHNGVLSGSEDARAIRWAALD